MAEPNLWEGILQAATLKSKLVDSTVLVAGLTGCGKAELFETFCPKMYADDEPEEDEIKFDHIKPITFNYFNATTDVEDGKESAVLVVDDSEALARVNVWSIDNKVTHNDMKMIFNIASSNSTSNKYTFVIVVDLNDPPIEVTKNVRSWIRRLQPEAEMLSLASETSQYVRTAKSLRGSINSSGGVEVVGLLPFQKLFPVPLVVVATKSDGIRTDDAVAAKAAKELQGRLRAICLQVGAALVYTAAADNETLINCGTLQKYLLHRLYPEAVQLTLKIQDGLVDAFIPSGFDTPELISISTGVQTQDVLNTLNERDEVAYAQRLFTGDDVVASSVAPGDVAAPVEPETEWLLSLQKSIQQLTGQTASAEDNSETTPSRRLLSRPAVPHQDEEEVRAFFKSLLTQAAPLAASPFSSPLKATPYKQR